MGSEVKIRRFLGEQEIKARRRHSEATLPPIESYLLERNTVRGLRVGQAWVQTLGYHFQRLWPCASSPLWASDFSSTVDDDDDLYFRWSLKGLNELIRIGSADPLVPTHQWQVIWLYFPSSSRTCFWIDLDSLLLCRPPFHSRQTAALCQHPSLSLVEVSKPWGPSQSHLRDLLHFKRILWIPCHIHYVLISLM